jgi:D-alanyl-D-alanine carboxypeptidase
MVIFTTWHVVQFQERKKEIQRIIQIEKENERILESAKEIFNDTSIIGKGAIVLDTKNNEILYQKNAFMPYGIASLTKLMTTDIALRSYGKDESITISNTAIQALGTSDIREGEIFNVITLVDHMLLASSNDASVAVSENDQAFISKMNARARSLGMHSFVFESVSGLDQNGTISAKGSAHDVAALLMHVYKTYRDVVEDLSVVEKDTMSYQGRTIRIVNTNTLLTNTPSIVFSKTGYTDLSGGSLGVIIKTEEGREIVIVVLGSTFQGRFSDVKTLIEKSFIYTQKLGGTM